MHFDSQISWDEYFLLIAQIVSVKSKDPSTKCGAVIVDDDHRILGLGYNGFAMGTPDDAELYGDRPIKYSRVIHAEMNAMMFAGGCKGTTLYTYPILPCDRCTVHMLQAGIKRFVVDRESTIRSYHHDSIRYIQECGAQIIPCQVRHQLNISQIGSQLETVEPAADSIRTTPLEDILLMPDRSSGIGKM